MFDEAKANEFYSDFLGFNVAFEHRFGENMPLYRGYTFGDFEIHLSEHHGDCSPGGAVRVEMSGLDDYHASLLGKDYKFAGPGIENQPWGYREFYVMDPFHNRLTFCEKSPA